MWVKKKRIIECNKSTVTCEVDTTQYDNKTVKCEKKIKNIKCDKSTVTYEVGTA